MEHQGTIAVVTGGAGGIGAATCRVLAREGARVVVADLDAERAVAVAAEVAGRAEVLDVTSLESARGLFARVREHHGAPANVLVNNAGFDVLEPFLENDPALWRRLIDVNLFGQIHCARAFLETAQGGRMVNIGSDAGRAGSGGEAVYSAAKGGVIALTKTLAREAARQGVAVNCICPGLTETALLDSFRARKPKWIDAVVASIPMRRSGRPDEIAEVISFLASARASYVTGQILSVNGGLTMVG